MPLTLSVFTRNIAEILLMATAVNVSAYLVFSPRVAVVDYFGLASDLAMIILLFFACFLLSRKGNPKAGHTILLVGFTVLYLSQLITVLGAVFILPDMVGIFGVKLVQVIAYCMIFLGIIQWLDYSAALEHSVGQLSCADELTGLMGPNAFLAAAESEVHRSLRFTQELSFILIDIDHFKDINQRFGRQGGDWVLREFAAIVARKLRDYDVLCRWGGDTFVLLVPKTREQQVLSIAEKLRDSIEHTEVRLSFRLKKNLRITASLGCATLGDDEDSLSSLLERAELALSEAKQAGRNRVCFLPYKPSSSQRSSTRALTA